MAFTDSDGNFKIVSLSRELPWKMKIIIHKKQRKSFGIIKGAQLSGLRLALGNQRFPVRVRLLAMCRGELSAVIAQLMPKCL